MAERCIVKSLGKSCTSFAGVHYNEMKVSFIYGQSLDFKELMQKMAELQDRIRHIE